MGAGASAQCETPILTLERAQLAKAINQVQMALRTQETVRSEERGDPCGFRRGETRTEGGVDVMYTPTHVPWKWKMDENGPERKRTFLYEQGFFHFHVMCSSECK